MTLTPGRIWPGTQYRFTNTYADGAGSAVDPATVAIWIIDPRGSVTSYVYGTDDVVGREVAGSYYADITLDQGGVWQYRWVATGTSTAIANEGTVQVQYSPFIDGTTQDYA